MNLNWSWGSALLAGLALLAAVDARPTRWRRNVYFNRGKAIKIGTLQTPSFCLRNVKKKKAKKKQTNKQKRTRCDGATVPLDGVFRNPIIRFR